jgi:hypothetical protein
MKLNCPTKEEELEKLVNPHVIFTFKKVRVEDGGCRWLEKVVRYYPHAKIWGDKGYEYPQKDERGIYRGTPSYYSLEGFRKEYPHTMI